MRILFFVLGFLLIGCGVKAPPVAPEHEPEHPSLNLNCSVNDPDCDKEDPKYVPKGKSGKYPEKNDD
jgi:hypothetical protein